MYFIKPAEAGKSNSKSNSSFLSSSKDIALFPILTILLTILITPSVSIAQIDSVLPGPEIDLPAVNETNSGRIEIVWRIEHNPDDLDSVIYELQEAGDSLFATSKVKYKGPDLATYVSGLANGRYYYRVRSFNKTRDQYSDWSPTVLVKVQHHSLGLAFTLFSIGAVVFILTVLVVVVGAYKNPVKDQENG